MQRMNSDGQGESINNTSLSLESEKILAYLERKLINNNEIPKARFAAGVLSVAVCMSAGLPFIPAGVTLGGDNKALGTFYAASGGGINACLYAAFGQQVVEWALNRIITAPELKSLMPAKYSKKSKMLFAMTLLNFALLSTIPYFGLSVETKSPIWITFINITANAIAHAKAFTMALESSNFAFHKHLTQLLHYATIRNPEQAIAYKKQIKAEFILGEIYQAVFRKFSTAMSNNRNKVSISDAILGEAQSDAEERTLTHTVAREITGGVMSMGALISLSGYFAACYYVLTEFVGLPLYLALPITFMANFFFGYLVAGSTYEMAQTKMVDFLVGLINSSLDEVTQDSHGLRAHPYLSMGILAVGGVFAFGSFASSVYLIQNNFPKVNMEEAIFTCTLFAYVFSGVFNVVGLPDFIKTVTQVLEFAKHKKTNEERSLLISEDSAELDLTAADKMKHDYLADLSLAQLSRLPESTFLLFFLNFIETLNNSESIVRNFSSEMVQNPGELRDFLRYQTTPSHFENTSSFFAGRTLSWVKEKMGCGQESGVDTGACPTSEEINISTKPASHV